MMTRLEKSTAIISKAKVSKWCYVNTENEFRFKDHTYVIDNSVEEYKVHNKAGTTYDYTNEAYMFEVLAVIDQDDNIKFYNQNYDYIKPENVYVRYVTW